MRSPELAIARVRERVRDGGHDIPEDVIRRRYIKGIRNFLSLYRPFVTTWAVYDNSLRHHPVLVANGRGTIVSNIYKPELWAKIGEAVQ